MVTAFRRLVLVVLGCIGLGLLVSFVTAVLVAGPIATITALKDETYSVLYAWPKNPPTFQALVTVYNTCMGATPGTSPIPVTFDARFCILVRFDRVLEGKCPFAANTRIVFLIHSPTLMFGGYGFDGKQFLFTMATWRPILRHQRFWLKRIDICSPGGRRASG